MIRRPIKLLIEMDVNAERDPAEVCTRLAKAMARTADNVQITLVSAAGVDDPFGPVAPLPKPWLLTLLAILGLEPIAPHRGQK